MASISSWVLGFVRPPVTPYGRTREPPATSATRPGREPRNPEHQDPGRRPVQAQTPTRGRHYPAGAVTGHQQARGHPGPGLTPASPVTVRHPPASLAAENSAPPA